jgi:hypothetical protein
MGEISVTGGARIGFVNATWPLAKLVASPPGLRLTCALDTYDFLSSEVVSLERYGSIPVFYNGVRIAHARPDYPSKIIFWCFGSPDELITRIRETGFMPSAPASSEIQSRGVPFRWIAVLAFIFVWNGLFFLINAAPHGSMNKPGTFALAPLLFAFLIAWGTKRSVKLQRIILKDARSVNEIKSFLSLIQTVSAFLLVEFVVLLFTGALS